MTTVGWTGRWIAAALLAGLTLATVLSWVPIVSLTKHLAPQQEKVGVLLYE